MELTPQQIEKFKKLHEPYGGELLNDAALDTEARDSLVKFFTKLLEIDMKHNPHLYLNHTLQERSNKHP